jgi:hypothetical protein
MKRRAFLGILAGSAALWPVDGLAQTPSKRWLIASLEGVTAPIRAASFEARARSLAGLVIVILARGHLRMTARDRATAEICDAVQLAARNPPHGDTSEAGSAGYATDLAKARSPLTRPTRSSHCASTFSASHALISDW